MERYEKYKDSGVEWIEEIPEGWNVRKLKYGVTVNPAKDDIDKNSNELVVFLPMEKVTEDGEIDCSIKKPISDLYNGYTFFQKNDVIVAKITPCFENGKSAILNNLETKFGFGSTEFHVLRAKQNVNNMFLYYITKSEIFMKVGEAFMSGAAGQKRVPTDFISDFPLVSPPLEEQIAIPNYLNRKMAEIDELITQKERLIEMYEEEKTAIINQAVTKGINPDVKLKDSGIDWLGEIPEGWEIKKLKYVTKDVITGKTPLSSEAEFYNGEINWFAPGDLNTGIKLSDSKKKITDYAVEKSGMKIFPKHTILLVGIGATVGKMGITKCSGTSNQQINAIIVREDKLNPYFALYFLLSFKTAINWLSNAATLPIFSQTQTKDFEIFIPDIKEQTAIVHHIETETARLNAKIAKTKKIIELQKEYRTALISEVVTGKIKVIQEVSS
ncbi:MAG: hypothetical protein GY795_33920 [Desulfobacterales bacterium]|nr:hypothetical protein [Desulfobacterales bacterium]